MTKITTAMVMAAGHGTRMRPLTNNTCKALVEVGGKALIDHMLDRLNEAGVTKAVVNVHAFADKLETHLRARQNGPEIIISDERSELLETGGGLVKALHLLGSDPILICNIDAVWHESRPAIGRLLAAWDEDKMDELFMLADRELSLGYNGSGDFDLDLSAIDWFKSFVHSGNVRVSLNKGRTGRLSRRKGTSSDYVYAGVQIFKPELASGYKVEKFSRNKIWDKTLNRGMAFGHVLEGYWMHVGDPEALKEAEAILPGKP